MVEARIELIVVPLCKHHAPHSFCMYPSETILSLRREIHSWYSLPIRTLNLRFNGVHIDDVNLTLEDLGMCNKFIVKVVENEVVVENRRVRRIVEFSTINKIKTKMNVFPSSLCKVLCGSHTLMIVSQMQ